MIDVTGFLKPAVEKLLAFIPDPKQKLEAQLALAQAQEEIVKAFAGVDAAQAQINAADAASGKWYQAGWRPFIGWTCGAAFAWQFLLEPMIVAVAAIAGHPVQLPHLDLSEMTPVLMGMLGLAGLRTYEKTAKK